MWKPCSVNSCPVLKLLCESPKQDRWLEPDKYARSKSFRQSGNGTGSNNSGLQGTLSQIEKKIGMFFCVGSLVFHTWHCSCCNVSLVFVAVCCCSGVVAFVSCGGIVAVVPVVLVVVHSNGELRLCIVNFFYARKKREKIIAKKQQPGDRTRKKIKRGENKKNAFDVPARNKFSKIQFSLVLEYQN